MRYLLLLLCVAASAGCQKANPTWATLSVRDAATKQPLTSPLVAIGPQVTEKRGTRAAAQADADGATRLMIEQGAVDYRVTVKAGPVTEHADLPPLVESFNDEAWHVTTPDGAFEVRLKRDAASNDPFAGLTEAE